MRCIGHSSYEASTVILSYVYMLHVLSIRCD